MNLIKNSKETTRFIRFAIIGTLGAVVDFSVFNLCSSLLNIDPVVSSVISFVAAVANNFIGNRFWTYPDSRSKPVLQQLGMFTLTNVIGLIIRTPIIAVLIPLFTNAADLIPFDLPLSDAVFAENFALAAAIGIVLIWNFVSNRFWTFNDVDRQLENEENE